VIRETREILVHKGLKVRKERRETKGTRGIRVSTGKGLGVALLVM
jgi:hypothetical protein